ncbi:hypothetical protein [Glycomyces paridis]|uniref:Uncharacterized protein n=1 Tax=Glycomyces paridis TaxID=2126555 RepID=A0A4S8PGJ1_9ACTN|nr:hypothetical protein [Glycomyces paridis]THV29648.1 hypothetical protein E9998_09195 [Glycomyces paridis]
MITTETMKIPFAITTVLGGVGVEVMLMPAEREVPEDWDDVRFTTARHTDGSPCASLCKCVVTEDRTMIRRGETVVIGEWTWFAGDASVLTGYRRTGPSETEAALEVRLEDLADDFAGEKILHDLTREDLERAVADAKRAGAERNTAQRTVTWWVEINMVLTDTLRLLFAAAVAGWAVTVVLGVTLVWWLIA